LIDSIDVGVGRLIMQNNNKRILMLGGAYAQIPAIKYAKEAGYYVITCDYLPENPGHAFADEYHNVSTIDKKKILELAKKLKIDGIVAYASDPSAITAAYVSDALGLPGASYRSVKILAEKDLFRSFLYKHGFNCPKYISISNLENLSKIKSVGYPCFVKPVDSSGSKGISRVENPKEIREALESALSFSRCKRVIVEEYVHTPYNQLHGDGFVFNGELVFLGICDQHFKNAVPISSTYPSRLSGNLIEKVRNEVSRLLKLIGFKNGAINVEARVTLDDKVYIMEIGPRSGGNYIPQLMQCATGFNEVAAVVETAMGNKPEAIINSDGSFCLQYIIGANESGKFSKIALSELIEKRVQTLYLHKKEEEIIKSYVNSSNVIGVLIAKCANAEELKSVIDDIYSHIRVVVEN
jgi:biotin carboxylase